MPETSIPSATLIFVKVLGDTVAAAEAALSGFTNITWIGSGGRPIRHPDDSWVVTDQEPADLIGEEVPSSLAITLTIVSLPPR